MKQISTLDSWKHFPREDLCRIYWPRYYHNQVVKLGCEANADYGNWLSIQKHMAHFYTASQASTSSSMPPPAALLSSMPPPSTVSPTSGSSSSTQSKCTKLSLGTRLSESQRQIALVVYTQMDDNKKWRLASGRCVEDVMHNMLITQPYEQYVLKCIVLELL